MLILISDEQQENDIFIENELENIEDSNKTSTNIYDPRQWKYIDTKFRDLIV